MPIIKQIYNNNIVLAIDERGDEVIVAGAGVGFSTGRGQKVDMSRAERVFQRTGMTRSGALRVLLELPPSIFHSTRLISQMLAEEKGIVLSPAAEIALADHLAQALKRREEGIPIYNSMLWETKMSYPAEFTLALKILDIVHKQFGVRLPLDEAGFVTMHLANVNAAGSSEQTIALGRVLHEVIAIVERCLGIALDQSKADITRFLTHVKFVVRRLLGHQTYQGGFDEMFQTLRSQDVDVYECALEIGAYLADQYATQLSDEEHFYLMIHLKRLADANAQHSGGSTEHHT